MIHSPIKLILYLKENCHYDCFYLTIAPLGILSGTVASVS